MALEAARLLERMNCDVRVYDPQGLPVKDEVSVGDRKVQELRSLSEWSEAQFWCSPEQHGNITAVMKNQSKSESDLDLLQALIVRELMISRLDSTLDRVSSTDARQSPWFRAGQSSRLEGVPASD
jgi:hypothetical protein